MMDNATAVRRFRKDPVRDVALAPVEEEELADAIRANFSELADKLSRLGDLYGDTLQGSHARAAAAAARRARLLAAHLH